jgi:type I restriction-modification system DNA methylase subunit
MSQVVARDRVKAGGIHYTPAPLAGFLAAMIVRNLPRTEGLINVLDPACGDGGLLLAFANAVPQQIRQRLVLTGYETDSEALDCAAATLKECAVAGISLRNEDFQMVFYRLSQT